MKEMTALDIARRLSELGKSEDACRAYELALRQNECVSPDDKMEAALYILQFGGDYKASYDCFLDLYAQGEYQEDCLNLLVGAFYEPNIKQIKARYEKNCRLLKKYPYLFRKDFLPFEELPICFFPYDDNGYRPFYVEEGRFDEYINFDDQVISRNFFRDLEKPILAADVFSQYELEYLNDNVRRSEDIGRENHIYLHFTSWPVFCAYLQVLEWKELLRQKKFVFLIEDELDQYPLDFQARFNIDYSQYPIKPLGIRDITRLIWHTQLFAHNGGDLFNEVFDAHPNLLCKSSMIWDEVRDNMKGVIEDMKQVKTLEDAHLVFAHWENPLLVTEFFRLKDRTLKDILVTFYLLGCSPSELATDARIAPAVFFQPHFYYFRYNFKGHERGGAFRSSLEYDDIQNSPIFNGFKYIKTFTPLRRFTTSMAATSRFMYQMCVNQRNKGIQKEETPLIVGTDPIEMVFEQPFMVDRNDRLYKDSIIVRFEDGKLNPTATFTALAAFVDLPYTESMTYCSEFGNRDFGSLGFNPVTVYRTYDEFLGENERYYAEFLLQEAYEYYGYDLHYYDGNPMDEDRLRELTNNFNVLEKYMRDTNIEAKEILRQREKGEEPLTEEEKQDVEAEVKRLIESIREINFSSGKMLMKGLRFVDEKGERLTMMPKLELDPALLEQPLYH